MNTNLAAGTACEAQESPISRANARAMRAMNETEKLVEELKARISVVLRPSAPTPCDPNSNLMKSPPRDLAAPLTDGTNDRANQIENTNTELRDIISRIEL